MIRVFECAKEKIYNLEQTSVLAVALPFLGIYWIIQAVLALYNSNFENISNIDLKNI